jgi:hypothetical protein
MSAFGGNSQWMQDLMNLFGQQGQGGQQGRDIVFGGGHHGYQPNASWAGTQSAMGSNYGTLYPFSQQGQQGRQQQAPTYGQALAGGALSDFGRGEQARQQELGMYMGLLGNMMGSMQGAGQMVQDVRQAGQRGMDMAQQQAGNIRQAAQGGQEYFDLARKQMESALGEARGGFGQSIGTLEKSRSSFDAGRRDDAAAAVMGIQQQYKNQIDAITRRDDLTEEQKGMMRDELQQGMRQQSSSIAAQADANARQTMIGLDQAIAGMQSQAASSMGQFGIGVGQALGGLGAQFSAQKVAAEENIANFFNNVQQYNTSMLQASQAAALNYALQGNQQMAQIINAAPFGPTSIFGTIAHMIQSVDEDRSNRMSPQMAGMFGRLA